MSHSEITKLNHSDHKLLRKIWHWRHRVACIACSCFSCHKYIVYPGRYAAWWKSLRLCPHVQLIYAWLTCPCLWKGQFLGNVLQYALFRVYVSYYKIEANIQTISFSWDCKSQISSDHGCVYAEKKSMPSINMWTFDILLQMAISKSKGKTKQETCKIRDHTHF